MARLELVRNDYGYPLTFTIKDAQEVVVDLTNATVKLKVKHPSSSSLLIDSACVVDGTPTTGICTYTVQLSDFDTIGRYTAELQVTWSGGKVMTATDLFIDIVADLGGT